MKRESHALREAAPPYGQLVKSHLSQLSSRSHPRSATEVIAAVRRGLPLAELEYLRESLALPLEELAPKIGLSRATLHRRKAEGRLTMAESDLVMRYARILGRAVQVFGGPEAARGWLRTAQPGLGMAVPLDFAETELGAREVENLLGRIEYGEYS